EDNVVFSIKRHDLLLTDYFFMFINRSEFNRRVRFDSIGSASEFFSWEDMCDITITLPPLSIQQKYVRIYNALRENLRVYERGLEDLKMVCDGFIEDLRRKIPCEKIGGYIVESVKKNDSGLSVDYVRGLATSKEIIETKADMTGVNLSTYKLLQPGQIAYVPDTSRRADKVSMGFNDTDNTFLVSSISIVFSTDSEKLLPEYLMLFLSRSEFDRYARFHSWGSARENFSFEDMCDVSIPIPDLATQESIANIYKVYQKRKSLSEKLKSLIKSICPVLIKGALEEAQKES
ncbi:MAG: restriction endonuclease subunit S, partial [Synergistaceae bacterium]|nr:restriction endonuclease subunit S [Synergistaceae bacterium]